MAVKHVARHQGGVELEAGDILLLPHPHLPPVRGTQLLQSEIRKMIIEAKVPIKRYKFPREMYEQCPDICESKEITAQ